MKYFNFLTIISLLFWGVAATTSCTKDKVEQNSNDTSDNDDTSSDDNNDSHIKYPHISEIGLFIFDGDNPLTDSDPIYSFSHESAVVLNPGRSCQMEIKQHGNDDLNKISGVWGLKLRTYDISLVQDNSCFSQSFEISADDFNKSGNYWRVELIAPDGSPYRMIWLQDGDITLYKELLTRTWDGNQGSIGITPSQSFYTDPNYGVQPKSVSFTFNNVRVGYYDQNGVKKAVRLHGVIEITKHK